MALTQDPTLISAFLSKLSIGNAFLLLCAFVTYCVLYQVIYYRFFHPLAKFPGPFWGSVTRMWIAYHNIKGDECAVFTELIKKHGTCASWKASTAALQTDSCTLGPVIRITPTMLLVNDATRLPDVYHRQANKSQHYITGSFGKAESVFNMQDWKQHAHHRKMIAGPVRDSILCYKLSLHTSQL